MGAEISVRKIEELSAKKVRKLKDSAVRDLQPEVKEIYESRIAMQRTTVEDMENFADVLKQNFMQRFLMDFKPEVRAVYERRVDYHNKLTEILENSMIEVLDESEQSANREDEDEKKEQEQEVEEKTLVELNNLYRTVEKRLSKETPNYVANSFGFIEKLGEGNSIFIHALYDPTLDSGTVTIRLDARVLREIKASLDDLQARPVPFDFYCSGVKMIAQLEADV